jgi:hypothetical protein
MASLWHILSFQCYYSYTLGLLLSIKYRQATAFSTRGKNSEAYRKDIQKESKKDD